MELKDWLLLFVPILFNGFLIFFFQLFITKNVEQRSNRKAYLFKVANELSSMLCTLHGMLLRLGREFSNNPNPYTNRLIHLPNYGILQMNLR